MNRIGVLAVLLALLVPGPQGQGFQDLNLRDNAIVFSGTGKGSLPDLKLFRDPTNNTIGMACINQPFIAELQKQNVADLANRLEILSKANDIRIHDGHCSLTFAVLVGRRREELQSTVEKASGRLAPEVTRLATRLREGVPARQEMVFHLLWSRVMDDAWDKAWKATFTTNGPSDTVWVVYPRQRYDVGTNYGSVPKNGSYALTWSQALRPQLQDLSGAIVDVFRVAWGKDVSAVDANRLRRLGFVDAKQKSRAFTFRAGDPVDKLLDQLTTEYAGLLARAYDYNALGKQFNLPPDQMFLILGHETAYSLLEKLSRSGQLEVPRVLLGQGDPSESLRLLSLKLVDNPPGPADDAMYLFVKAGWRGNAETARAFRRVVEADPQNLSAWLYLGMSLYEIENYRGAIAVFDQLTQHAGSDTQMRDWGRIWSAQMYDLLGEREQALELYRIVTSSEDNEQMQFGQYDIGPVTARDWAKQRLESPFTRR